MEWIRDNYIFGPPTIRLILFSSPTVQFNKTGRPPPIRRTSSVLIRLLEALNNVKESLKSTLLNGKWELLYTTSTSILQTERPKFLRANGKIYQAINVDTLRAQNMETWPFFNQIPIKSRGSGRGQIEITYLDEELRITRGKQGNLYILRMVDPLYRVPL